MARNRPVRVPTSAMPAAIAPAMSANTLSIACRVFSLSMGAKRSILFDMRAPNRVTLEGHAVRLEPLAREHRDALAAAAADGELWQLWFTSVPRPEETERYIAQALTGQEAGHMLPFVVRELDSGTIVGSTRYHDIVKEASRVEIGYTWYAKRWQKTHVNTVCKLLLFGHAFEALGCKVVGLRTDNFNFASQRAIEAL